jgi:hypothetical protein
MSTEFDEIRYSYWANNLFTKMQDELDRRLGDLAERLRDSDEELERRMLGTIYNDQRAPRAISIWCNNHLTNNVPVCVEPSTTNIVRIGDPGDDSWYALASTLNNADENEQCVLSHIGWEKVSIGPCTPPAYIWRTEDDTVFIALPHFETFRAKELGISFDDWRDMMKKYAVKALAV